MAGTSQRSGQAHYDVIVVGAGSAGCACAARLAALGVGRVAVLEAGPRDTGPLVKVPFGLIWLMGSRRDWRLQSAPQKALGGRRVKIPRGRMLGGSGSINSMVWFRGRRDDFDGWGVPGWAAADVWPDFDAVEARLAPTRLPSPHPLAEALGRTLGSNGAAPPTPEYESAGVFHANMRNGRRWSAADAYLRPSGVTALTGATVDRVVFNGDRATGVCLADGSRIDAAKGVVLTAGAIGSPEIALRSGLGPREDLGRLGIDCRLDAPGVGDNLHDHPAVGLHHQGARSGYGLTIGQAPMWALAPFRWLLTGTGVMASNSVEAGAFLDATGHGKPDCQVHFIPYFMGWQGRTIVPGKSGYFADVCVSRPKSRGRLRLDGKDPRAVPEIDLGLLTDDDDIATLVAGFRRLRRLLDEAPFGNRKAPEVHPAQKARTDDEIAAHIRASCGTSYHPVGTMRMGDEGPVTLRLAVRGVRGLFVADASVMPSITSANTNAPSIMIGHRGAQMIADDLEAA